MYVFHIIHLRENKNSISFGKYFVIIVKSIYVTTFGKNVDFTEFWLNVY